MPLREIAEAVGVSHQRVHQIVGEEAAQSRVSRVIAKRARASGAALILVLSVSWWIASSSGPQPCADVLADLEDARNLIASRLPEEGRDFILPKLDEMLDQADG